MAVRKNAETDNEIDALFLTIGKYIVFFQWIEGVVDQCLLLLWGYENWSESQNRLAGMLNYDKVEALLQECKTNPANLRGQNRLDWCHQFEALIERLHEERRQRNSLLHSQHIFDVLEIGQPILQSDRRRRNGVGAFARQDLSRATQEALLGRVAHLAIDLRIAHVQLISDFGTHETEQASTAK